MKCILFIVYPFRLLQSLKQWHSYFNTNLHYHFLETSVYSPSGLSYPLMGGVLTGPRTVKGSSVGLICNKKKTLLKYNTFFRMMCFPVNSVRTYKFQGIPVVRCFSC